MIVSLLLAAAAQLPSSPSLGVAEGRCRANEPGPAILVEVAGLKDRQGLLKLEAYPSNDRDFLADDNVLVMARKVFRRVTGPVPARGGVQICIRVPAPAPTASPFFTTAIPTGSSDCRSMAWGFRTIPGSAFRGRARRRPGWWPGRASPGSGSS